MGDAGSLAAAEARGRSCSSRSGARDRRAARARARATRPTACAAVWDHTLREGVEDPAPSGRARARRGPRGARRARRGAGGERPPARAGRAAGASLGARDRQALRRTDRGSPAGYDEEAAAGSRPRRPTTTARPALRQRPVPAQPRPAQRRLRKWGAARDSLERAVAAFDALGSTGWAEQARSELARVGARRPAPSGELTPTEQRGQTRRRRACQQGDRGRASSPFTRSRRTSHTPTRSSASARATSSRPGSPAQP